MADDGPEKMEKTKKCLAALKLLRQHIAELRAASLDALEKQYVDSSHVHSDRIRNCLNNLFFKLQESLESKGQGRDAKGKQ